MAGPTREIRVRLQRDALTTPWGFRLQGGKDFKAPLTVQRVFVGSPADGELHRGDVISSIENYDTSGLAHKQAQDLIKAAGGQLMLSVKRGVPRGSAPLSPNTPTQPTQQAYRSRPLDITPVPKQQAPMYGPGAQSNFGTDFSRRYGGQPAVTARPAPMPSGGMLNKVQNSLNQAIWQPGGDYDQQGDPDYEHRPVGQIKAMFSGRPGQRAPPPQTGGGRHKVWKKPDASSAPPLADLGWSPGHPQQQQQQRHRSGWSPVKGPASMGSQRGPPLPAQVPVNRQQEAPRQIGYDERPAWAGTLKSAGGAKPWEVHAAADAAGPLPAGPPPAAVQPHQPRVQNVHYGPGDSAPRYEQHSPSTGDHKDAAVVHAQYNSPLGLYSKENVVEALEGQTRGKPGEGTLQVISTGGGGGGGRGGPVDFRQSDVARMVAEEEGRYKKPRGYGLHPQQQQQPQQPQQSARYQEQSPGEEINYQGYQDPSRQSQSFRALEANMAMQGEDTGASDF